MDREDAVPLTRLAREQRATVVALGGGRAFQSRAGSMGLHVGARVEVLQGGCRRGGPVLAAVGETRLALGCGMAEKILVVPDPVGEPERKDASPA